MFHSAIHIFHSANHISHTVNQTFPLPPASSASLRGFSASLRARTESHPGAPDTLKVLKRWASRFFMHYFCSNLALADTVGHGGRHQNHEEKKKTQPGIFQRRHVVHQHHAGARPAGHRRVFRHHGGQFRPLGEGELHRPGDAFRQRRRRPDAPHASRTLPPALRAPRGLHLKGNRHARTGRSVGHRPCRISRHEPHPRLLRNPPESGLRQQRQPGALHSRPQRPERGDRRRLPERPHGQRQPQHPANQPCPPGGGRAAGIRVLLADQQHDPPERSRDAHLPAASPSTR